MASIYYLQHKIIYMPRQYDTMKAYYEKRCANVHGLQQLKFDTSQGHQIAHCLLPQPLEHGEAKASARDVKVVWIFFNGNAGLGLDWLEFADMYRDTLAHRQRANQLGLSLSLNTAPDSGPRKKLAEISHHLHQPQPQHTTSTKQSYSALVLEEVGNTAMLFIDYPGYGYCQGQPSPTTILESTDKAVTSLVASLGVERKAIQFNVIGHSLGCAAALQWITTVTANESVPPASALPLSVGRVVLLAPFTSLAAVATHLIGYIPLLRWLLRHNFDNERQLQAFLNNIKNQPTQPVVCIMHGTQDTIVPAIMGRSLSMLAEDRIYYAEISHADHNNLLDVATDSIFTAMMLTPTHDSTSHWPY